MEEKKLTDEEIVKDFSELIGYETGGFDIFPTKLNEKILDLIHRLQAEKEEIKNEYVKLDLECQKLKTENAELKSPKFASWKLKFFKAQEEIERLTEYNANLNGMCLEFIDKNAELQKQANDWKERANIDIKNERNWSKIQIKQAVKDTAKEIYGQMLEWIPICEGYGEFIDNFESWLKERYGLEVE